MQGSPGDRRGGGRGLGLAGTRAAQLAAGWREAPGALNAAFVRQSELLFR